MRELIEVGDHCVVIETAPALGQPEAWGARWAVYASQKLAIDDSGFQGSSLVSGTTAVFPSRDDAHAQAMLDASRTSSVFSGTYRATVTP